MPDEAAIRTIRAAVEAIVPSVDGRPGGADLGVERHVVESFERYVPGFAELLARLLEAFASDVRAGVGFADLEPDERREVLRLMSREESSELQDCVDGLLVFTYGGFYSEWTGLDPASGRLDPPSVWRDMGHGGPSDGHRVYGEGG
jgi:Gluconate 2-dehydrogenase subunit 3